MPTLDAAFQRATQTAFSRILRRYGPASAARPRPAAEVNRLIEDLRVEKHSVLVEMGVVIECDNPSVAA